MNREPVRITIGLAALATIALNAVIAWLGGTDWRAVIAQALTGIVVLLGGAEAARGKVKPWPPSPGNPPINPVT